MKSYIYALTDPDTGAICYVGKSDDPDHRYYHHVTSGVREGDTSKKAQWLRDLMAQGKKPGIRVLEETTTDLVMELEKEWIQRLCSEGVGLVNDMHTPRPPKAKVDYSGRADFYPSEQTYEAGSQLLSVAEVAALHGVMTAAIYLAVKSGNLPSTLMLGKFAVHKKDAQAYDPRAYRGRAGSKGGRPKKEVEE